VILLRKLLAAPLPGRKTRSGGFKKLGKKFEKKMSLFKRWVSPIYITFWWPEEIK